MATRVGALFADLTLNSTKWSAGLRKAANDATGFNARTNRALNSVQRKLDATGRDFARLAKRTLSLRSAVVTLAGAGGLGLLVKNAVKAADTIGKTADKIGVTTDELQELRFAADQVGVSQNTLDLALQRFSRRVGEARQGSGELKDTLKQYGIELRNANGSSKTLTDILGQLANATKNAGDESEQLRIAFKAFDSEGAALVNVLRQGEDGMNALRSEARSLGAVIDESVIRKSEDAQSKIGALSRVMSAQFTTALVELAPVLIAFANQLARAATATNRLFQNVKNFFPSTADLETSLAREAKLEDELNKKLDEQFRLRLALNNPTASRTIDVNNPLSGKSIVELDADIAELQAQLKTTRDRIAELQSTTVTVFGGTFVPQVDAAKKALEELTKQQQKTIDTANQTIRRPDVQSPRLPTADTPGAELAPSFFPQADERARAFALEQQIIRAQITGNDELIARLRLRNELGPVPPHVLDSLVQAQLETDRLREVSSQLSSVFTQVGDAIGQAFGDLFTRTKSLKDSILDLARSLSRLGTQTFLQQGVSSLFQTGASSFFGSLASSGGGLGAGIPGRAGGGPVTANKPFLVGESGVELFVPRTSGQVVPNSSLNGGLLGGGSGVTVNNFVSATDVDSFDASLSQLSASTFRDVSREAGRLN